MKNLTSRFIVWYIVAILVPMTSFAYYHRDQSGKDVQTVPALLIVKLRADTKPVLSQTRGGIMAVGAPGFDALNRAYGIRKQSRLYPSAGEQYRPDPLKSVFVIEVPEQADIQQMQADYEALDVVVYAEPDRQLELYDTPNDSLYPHQWALNNTGQGHYCVERHVGDYNDVLVISYGVADADIDAQEVFDNPPDNTLTVIVAIIDTGVDLDNPELAGRIWYNSGEIADNGLDDDHNGYIDDVVGWDFAGDGGFPPVADNDPTDAHGHGTHCAGIVTAVANNASGIAGITPDCRIMALSFAPIMLSSFGAQAIVYAADNGADVISMSWGYPWPVQVLDDALDYARSKGVILCAAAGNDGAEFANYPAACAGVITVGATTDSDRVTDFSTYGDHLEISAPGLCILSLRADTTDMYASHKEPGVHIIDSHYYLASGTSMACPHVAAVAAYLRAVSAGLIPDATQQILESTSDDIVDPYGAGDSLPGWDKYSGYGRVNLNQALVAAPSLRAKIQTPAPNQLVSGTVDIVGTADGDTFPGYVLEYGDGSVPTVWQEIYSSATPVTGGTLGQWSTDSLEGQYSVRVRVGETNVSSVTIHVSNTTAATILAPLASDTIVSWTAVTGTATSPDLSYYRVEYGAGASPSTWHEIAESSVPVVSDELAIWNTSALPDGLYTLLLSVFSGGGLEASDSVLVFVQSPFSGENGWKVSLSNTVAVVPNYGDFNNDGVNEVVVGTEDTLLFYNPDGIPKTTGVPALPGYDFRIPVAVGDLDGDDVDDFVAVGAYSTFAKLFGFPSSEPSFEVDLQEPPHGISTSWSDDYKFPYVFLRDIDGDGRDEIHYHPGHSGEGEPFQYYIYNSDGSFRIGLPPDPDVMNDPFYCYLSADLDNDGADEFYLTTSTYFITSTLYEVDTSGTIQDSFDLEMGLGNVFMSKSLSAVDMDGDGKLELIVFGYLNESLGQWWTFAFDEDLALKPGWPQCSGIDDYLVPSVPVFADIDDDGSVEYFMTVYELSSGEAYAWHTDGSAFSGDSTFAIFAATPNPSKLYSPIIADIDGDWSPDLLACAETDVFCTYDAERIVAWSKDGQMLPGWPLVTAADGATCYETSRNTPAVGDIDKDGYVDLIMTTPANEILFFNLEGTHFLPQYSPIPFWRYNRRMNNIGPVRDTTSICGDINGSGIGPNISDLVYLVDYLFFNGSSPPVMEMANVNGEGGINVADLTYLVEYLFFEGPEPVCGSIP